MDFSTIKWSDKELSLIEFTVAYQLPQIVKVKEGYHDAEEESSLSKGQILKLYSVVKEDRILCEDRNNKEMFFPVHTQKLTLKPANYSQIYHKVSDLAQCKHLPKYVEISRGFMNSDHQELTVDPGELLEVVGITQTSSFKKKNRSMTFRNADGALLKLPYEFTAGFKSMGNYAMKQYTLKNFLSSEPFHTQFPFHFTFEDEIGKQLGVLKAKKIYQEELILASNCDGNTEVIFMIPKKLNVKLKVAFGTLAVDPIYDEAIKNANDYENLENDIKRSSIYKRRMFRETHSNIYTIQLSRNPSRNVDNKLCEQNVMNHAENDSNVSNSTESGYVIYQNENNHDDYQNKHSVVVKSGENEECNHGDKITAEDKDYDDPLEFEKQEHVYEVLIGDFNPDTFKYGTTHCEILSNEKQAEARNFKKSELEKVSVKMLGNILKDLNMSQHIDTFNQNQVDGSLFCELNDEELKDLGLNNFEIKKVFKYRNGWRPRFT